MISYEAILLYLNFLITFMSIIYVYKFIFKGYKISFI